VLAAAAVSAGPTNSDLAQWPRTRNAAHASKSS